MAFGNALHAPRLVSRLKNDKLDLSVDFHFLLDGVEMIFPRSALLEYSNFFEFLVLCIETFIDCILDD